MKGVIAIYNDKDSSYLSGLKKITNEMIKCCGVDKVFLCFTDKKAFDNYANDCKVEQVFKLSDIYSKNEYIDMCKLVCLNRIENKTDLIKSQITDLEIRYNYDNYKERVLNKMDVSDIKNLVEKGYNDNICITKKASNVLKNDKDLYKREV